MDQDDDRQPEQLKLTIDGPTLEAFLDDYSFVSIIRGPWGSGKSVTCIAKLFDIASRQRPNRLGKRKTRWAVVRNTYAELRDTTIKTWLDWFPEDVYGPMIKQRPYTHVIKVPGAPDARGRATMVEMEVIFVALDDESDRKKLLSLELTGVWVNEAREIIKGIIDDIIGRTGRYPSKRDGGHSWSGCIMDTNAPAETHWLPIMMGESPAPEDMSEDERDGLIRPDDWTYYVQPGALIPVRDATGKTVDFAPNPIAENIRNLTDGFGYYLKRKGGKTRSWVLVNFCNELGQLVAGKPVWPTFEKAKHVARSPIAFDPTRHLYVGIDQTGRNPAAIAGQVHGGHWSMIAELVGKDISSDAFAPQVKRWLSGIISPTGLSLAQVRISFFRDPHDQRNSTDDDTAQLVYRKHGILLIPAPGGNGIKQRTETVETLFDHDKITISPTCIRYIAACEGGYRFKKLKISGIEAYEPEPDKRNGHADIADASQYLFLGAGEGRSMLKGSEPRKPVVVTTGYRPGQHRESYRRRAHG
jgi:hypothetical protein